MVPRASTLIPCCCALVVMAMAPAPRFDWQPQTSGVTARLRGISAVSERVAWVPGKQPALIAAGPSGTDWSADEGRTWTPVAGGGFDTFSFAAGTRTAGGSGANGRLAKPTIGVPDRPARFQD